MEAKAVLEKMGLNGKKADVYLAALELGGASTIEIAKKAAIKRTTCYDILLDLKREGLVLETAEGKKRLFVGENPEKIQKDFKRKEALFLEVLPMLKSIHNVKGSKPKIYFYEGVEGVKEVYSDTLKYSGEFLAFGSEDIIRVVGDDWMQRFIKNRIRKGIRVRAILPKTDYTSEKLHQNDPAQLRSTKLIDKNKYPFSVEIDIYGHGRISLISAKEIMAVIIESVEIYNTLKCIFEALWDHLPEVKR
jgi:HTH-type transcriptional regulator, sugar sensing transcriptional regulator